MTEFAGSGSVTKTDLFNIFNYVQNTQIFYPKQQLISTIRDVFSQDSTYHYVKDKWGYPYTPDLTDVPPDAGIHDDLTTRVWIGEARFDVLFYPAIIVRNGGSNYVPISINREKETILYDTTLVYDGYGNSKQYTTPVATVFAGAWEGSINIQIMSRGMRERDDLVELVSIICTDLRFEELLRSGILIKRVSVGSPSENDDRNDKLYSQTVSLDIRSEWRREIPIDNIIDSINFCIEFGHFDKSNQFYPDPNLEINTKITLLESIQGL
jgi:hypothetical protein